MSNKCATCLKSVYPMEQVIYDGVYYHKSGCFKCKQCNCTMGLSSVAKIAGDLYCKPCFKKIFKEKGTYASFGAHTLAQNAPTKDLIAAGLSPSPTSSGVSPKADSPDFPVSPVASTPTVAAKSAEEAVKSPETVPDAEQKKTRENPEVFSSAQLEDASPEVPKQGEAVTAEESSKDDETRDVVAPLVVETVSSPITSLSSPYTPTTRASMAAAGMGSPAVETMGSELPSRPSVARASISLGGTTKKCGKCEKTVYPIEEIIYDGVSYHKSGCFKCKACNCTMGLSSVAKIAGDLYCKPCFKKTFKEKGTYASFGAHTLAQNAPMKDKIAAGVVDQ